MTAAAGVAWIPVPVEEGTRARAYVECLDGAHRVYFGLDGGRRHSKPVGPAFKKPRDAVAFAALINGETPTSRRVPHSSSPSTAAAAEIEAPAGAPDQSLTPAGVNGVGSTPRAGASGERIPESGAPRLCAGCDEPLPLGARRDRRTHGNACRLAAYRRRQAEAPAADAEGAASLVTPLAASGAEAVA